MTDEQELTPEELISPPPAERQPKRKRQAVVAKLRIGPDLIEFFREDELAEQLRVTVRTLRRWHALRIGPPRTVVSRSIYYRKQAVLEWLLAKEERLPARRRAR